MSSIQETIASFLSKKLEINLINKTYNLHVIDWKTITEEHETMMEKTEGMEDEEVGEFLCDNESELMQITEYFMNDACDEKVEDDKWLPFGLLGLTHHPHSFAEKGNSGLLLFDMTKGKNDNPPVILFTKGKAQVIADDFTALNIKEIIEQ
jgi:hypothetical protein